MGFDEMSIKFNVNKENEIHYTIECGVIEVMTLLDALRSNLKVLEGGFSYVMDNNPTEEKKSNINYTRRKYNTIIQNLEGCLHG